MSVKRTASIAALKKRLGSDVELPKGYDPELHEAVSRYMLSDELPRTDRKAFNKAPPGDKFRLFPQKAREALRLASSNAQLVFLALWQQHEDRYAAQNGLLYASIGFLMDVTAIGNRNNIQDSVDELENRGLVRVLRGRGGDRGVKHANCFLLTCFPDALGRPPTQDYLEMGLPREKPTSNHPATRHAEAQQIKARFAAHINLKVKLTKAIRRGRQTP